MNQKKAFGYWYMEFDPDDGARIGRLSYKGTDLLTTPSEQKQLPGKDYGKFETRPVYGYDDCFPGVDPAVYPGPAWEIPDHGELCWLPWNVESRPAGLRFSVNSEMLPLRITREMVFHNDRLEWNFEVANKGNRSWPFQHVMHPLLPLENIINIGLPEFETVTDDIENKVMDMKTARDVRDYLLSTSRGRHHMLFLHRVKEGRVKWEYAGGIAVDMIYDREMFPSLGIWWDNHSYPDEDGCRRTECAFEPTPGNNSNLADAYREGMCLYARPGRPVSWTIIWKIGKT